MDEPRPIEQPLPANQAVAFARGGDLPEAPDDGGYFVVQLHLFTVEDGGQDRHLQSGFRAIWTADGIAHAMGGPIELAEGGRSSVAPGEDAEVHVHPDLPAAWAEVRPGTRLRLCRNLPRAIGEGRVIKRVPNAP